MHLGLSLSHGIPSGSGEDRTARYRTRPESHLTDDRLVDTGELTIRSQELINVEGAWLNGPFSIQGEYFYVIADGDERLNFKGWYLYGSYVLTGEHRAYRRAGGVFGSISPNRPFNPFNGSWGAVELGLRFSSIDLNSGAIKGGGERNITVGLNWYLQRKIRLMVNYVHAVVEDRGAPVVDHGVANIVMARFQTHF